MNQIARDTGYSQTWVSQMFKSGLTEKQIRDRAKARDSGGKTTVAKGTGLAAPRAGTRGGQKPGADTGHAMIAANRERAVRGKTGETMLDVSLRKEIAIADQRELELQVRRNEMVPRHMMREWIAEAFVGAKDTLLKIAPELKDRLAAESDPVRIEAIIQGEVETALRHVSELLRRLANEARAAA